jgi:hypothetical protein
MEKKDYDDFKGPDGLRWMSVDLFSFKRKGLSNDKISRMTGIPVQIINDHFEEIDAVKGRSGIF